MNGEPSDRLRRARIAKGFDTAAMAARAHGWSEVTYTSHENGTRGIRPDAARRYAQAFGLRVSELLNIPADVDVQHVAVTAIAAFGVWREVTLDSERRVNGKSLLSVAAGGAKMSFAWEAGDDSANKSVAKGEFAICVPVSGGQIESGALVAVERVRGDLVERTLRRVVAVRNGEIILEPHSTERRYAGQMTIPAKAANEVVRIIGRVVGKYAEIQ